MTKHTEASAEAEEISNDELFESWLTEKRNELESIDVESLCRMVRLATQREGQSALLTEQEKVRELEIENNQLNAHLSRIGLIVDDVDYLGEHSVGVQILKDKVADLTAKVAELEGIANSDDGAGGEGMRLYLENKDMTKKIADLTARLEAQGASDPVKIQSIHMLMAEGYSVPLQILDTSLCPTGLQINVASSTKQEASEPVAWQFFQDGKWHNGMETNNHRENTEKAGYPVRDLYTTPQPTPTVKAAVAVALRKAAEVCDSYRGHTAGEWKAKQAILAIPHDDSALMEFGVKVAREFVDPATSDARLEAIVNRVLKGEAK